MKVLKWSIVGLGVGLVLMLSLLLMGKPATEVFGVDGKSSGTWIAELKDPKVNVRIHAASALGGSVGRCIASRSVPALAEALQQDQSAKVRCQAASSLGWIGPKAKAAVPALIAALRDHDTHVRIAAAEASIRIDSTKAKEAVPILTAALENQDPSARLGAAEALVRLDAAQADQAVPVLIAAVEDQNSYVRFRGIEALNQMDPAQVEVAMPVLIAALRDPNSGGRAAAALGRLGPAAAPAVPALSATLNVLNEQEQYIVRMDTIEALGSIGPAAKDAVPVLIASLNAHDPWIRINTAKALIRIDSAQTKTAVSALRAMLQEDLDFGVHQEVRMVLQRIDPGAARKVPTDQ